MNPRVKAVKVRDNHTLEITFSNGEVGVYDCSPLLNFGIFTELKDKIYFQQVRESLDKSPQELESVFYTYKS